MDNKPDLLEDYGHICEKIGYLEAWADTTKGFEYGHEVILFISKLVKIVQKSDDSKEE